MIFVLEEADPLIVSGNLFGFLIIILISIVLLIDRLGGDLRELQKENAQQAEMINLKPDYPVALTEKVITLQTEIDQLKNQPSSNGPFNLGTMADRLAGVSQEVTAVKMTTDRNQSALYTHAQDLRTGATLSDARNNFYAKIALAQQLLAAGKPEMAKFITMAGITDLSIASCGNREAEFAIWLMPDSLLALVQADLAPLYTFQADPVRNAMKITWTNPTPGC